MKKLLFLLAALLVLALPVVAQEIENSIVIPPGIVEYFTTLSALAGAVLVVTQFALKFIHTKFDQYFSWLMAVILSVVGWLFQIGVFVELPWWSIPIYATAAGLAANGLYDINVINWVLNVVFAKAKNKK